MFYHCRELKYVTYGKVFPPPDDAQDESYTKCYRWLGHYCGFTPQIWLARSTSHITGFRSSDKCKKWEKDQILFGFEHIQGFGVDYSFWCELMNPIMNSEKIACFMDYMVDASADGLHYAAYKESRNVEDTLNRFLFVENDQVVVPSLNLKAAKKIICRNERQKKVLRKMGFIEDRIQVHNTHRRSY